MANKHKNEMIIKIGGEDILLRPSFENIATLESNVGSLAWLAFKFTSQDGKGMPSMTDCARIIYFCQAASDPNDSSKKLKNLEEVWDLMQDTGMQSMTEVVKFLSQVASGNKVAVELSDTQKKS